MKYGFIGTGLMGYPMVEKLLENSIKPFVYNRTKEKTAGLAEKGAIVTNTCGELIKQSDVVILMLADYHAVCQSLFCGVSFEGKLIINMSTISPEENVLLAERVNENNGTFLEAPVLGSIPQIQASQLIVMVSGAEADFNKHKEFFTIFGEEIHYAGKAGSASAIKLSLNHLIASLTASFSLSLGYLRERDENIDLFMDILRKSALYAPTFDKKLDKMLSRNFENPNFPLKHLLKDISLMLGEFKLKGLNTVQLEGVKNIVKEGLQSGDGDKDYSSLYNSVHYK